MSENINHYVVFLVHRQLFQHVILNECFTIIKGVQDHIFICEPLFPYHFLLIATMTKATFINSQQFLCLILSMCEVITNHKINMNSFILSTLSRSQQDSKALDSTLIFIIESSRTRLQKEITMQNSKLLDIKNFKLLDQDTTKRIELNKAVKIGV